MYVAREMQDTVLSYLNQFKVVVSLRAGEHDGPLLGRCVNEVFYAHEQIGRMLYLVDENRRAP